MSKNLPVPGARVRVQSNADFLSQMWAQWFMNSVHSNCMLKECWRVPQSGTLSCMAGSITRSLPDTGFLINSHGV